MPLDEEDERAFAAVTRGHGRDLPAAQLAGALRVVCAMLEVTPDEQLERFATLVYLFGRLARTRADAHAALAPVATAYRGPHAPVIARIAELDGVFPDARTISLDDHRHLDLVWAELFATGDRAVLDRLVALLDGPDRVRAHVERWLGERSWFGGGKRRARAEALAVVGLDVDLDARVIRRDGDLDLWAWRAAEARTPVFPPLDLPHDDVMAVAIKGTALWSLRLVARDHAAVADVCRAAAEAPGGPGRALLRETVPADAPSFAL